MSRKKTRTNRKTTGYTCRLHYYNSYNTPEGLKTYCKELGITPFTYNNYIYNYNMPRLQRAIEISKVLRVPIQELWIKSEVDDE